MQACLQRLDRTQGPVFISFHKGGRLTKRRLTNHPLNLIVQRYPGSKFSAHSLKASFASVAKLARADNSAVMNQTKYKPSVMIRRYTRLDNVRQYNAAQKLG